jgi:hypothetical protein
LFPLCNIWVALQLQLCLVSSSPRNVWQFSFECCALSQRSALGSTTCPALEGLTVSPPLLSAFVLFLISVEYWWLFWEVGLLPCPCSQPLMLFLCFIESLGLRLWLLVPPLFSGVGSAFHPHLHCQYWITVCSLCFSVWLGARGLVCPGAVLDYFPMDWIEESCVMCDAHLFILQFHAGSLELAGGEKLSCFFQCSTV